MGFYCLFYHPHNYGQCGAYSYYGKKKQWVIVCSHFSPFIDSDATIFERADSLNVSLLGEEQTGGIL